MSRPRRRGAEPRQGESLVDGLFRRLGLGDEARRWRALYAWREAAGPRIAARARAERMQGATMVLRVQSAAWANELGFLKRDLLARLRATAGAEWVEDLRFSIGPLDGAPSWDDDQAPAPAPPAPELPPVADGEVAAALRQVDDPELRAALAELFARARHRPEK